MPQFFDSAEPNVIFANSDQVRIAFHNLNSVGIRIEFCFRSSIAAVLVIDNEIVGRGHNQRVQKSSAILHAEMDSVPG